jgi:hypothetical protein
MRLGRPQPCRSCEKPIAICAVRGGTWMPFELELIPAAADAVDAFLPLRHGPVVIFTPVDEVAPRHRDPTRHPEDLVTKPLSGIALAALLLAGCSHPAPKPLRATTPSPSVSADRAGDLGPGKPGAYCGASRLGKRFTKDGVTYVCKGPKPYRWREAS